MLQTVRHLFFIWLLGGEEWQWISLPNHFLHKLVLETICILGAQVVGVMDGVK